MFLAKESGIHCNKSRYILSELSVVKSSSSFPYSTIDSLTVRLSCTVICELLCHVFFHLSLHVFSTFVLCHKIARNTHHKNMSYITLICVIKDCGEKILVLSKEGSSL